MGHKTLLSYTALHVAISYVLKVQKCEKVLWSTMLNDLRVNMYMYAWSSAVNSVLIQLSSLILIPGPHVRPIHYSTNLRINPVGIKVFREAIYLSRRVRKTPEVRKFDSTEAWFALVTCHWWTPLLASFCSYSPFELEWGDPWFLSHLHEEIRSNAVAVEHQICESYNNNMIT